MAATLPKIPLATAAATVGMLLLLLITLSTATAEHIAPAQDDDQLPEANYCNVDLMKLESLCGQYVNGHGAKQQPSQQCCQIVKQIDIPCACKYFANHPLPPNIDVGKVCYVATCCGCSYKPGMNCGDLKCSANIDGGADTLYWLTKDLDM